MAETETQTTATAVIAPAVKTKDGQVSYRPVPPISKGGGGMKRSIRSIRSSKRRKIRKKKHKKQQKKIKKGK